MATDPGIRMVSVEVAYATPSLQLVVPIEVPVGCTVEQAIELSGIRERFPDLQVDRDNVGIFSRKVALDKALLDGDRVEIYRPLIADPKEARRERANLRRRR
jgi:hypothetical protein